MGSVFLVVTGAEALYADMGHFGRRPIRLAWFGLVLPALLLNYFGQGALLLADPATIRNPFYLMAPDWFLLPLVGLATAATVIASQAVITGVYSITQQAIQLGYAPRMELRHTSGIQMGQIYMPGVNWMMLLGVIALVLAFKSSTNLAAAYGIAVTGTMIITTLFAYLVACRQWGWRRRLALPVFGALLALDLVFLAANSTKILDGGWFPLVFGGAVYLVLTTWKAGRKLLHEKLDTQSLFLQRYSSSASRPRTPSPCPARRCS
jgi:KUP system potassium uptake protein